MAGRTLLGVTAAALALAGLAGCGASAHPPPTPSRQRFEGAVLPGDVQAPTFALTALEGGKVSLGEHRGQVTVLAFLYSGCTACVLIAQQIRGALEEVSPRPPVLFVSVDPARDTPARVNAFLRRVSLAGRVRYLLGPRSALEATWRAYRVRTPASGQAAFEAGAPVLLIDARGHERVLFEQEQLTPEALAHDIRELRSEG